MDFQGFVPHVFAVGQVFFEEKVPIPLEFSLNFCYMNTLQLVVFADFEITNLSSPPPTKLFSNFFRI